MSGCTSLAWDSYTATQSLKSINMQAGLYTNNHTPAPGDLLSAFTECTAAGYAQQSLPAGSWTITNEADDIVAVQPTVTFTPTAGATIYGYFITNSGSTNFIFAELFAGGPYTFSGGFSLSFTPKIKIGTTIDP
jgi:hypothetical protein